MQTSQIISLLLFLSGWTISCFPTKPLNERSTELTWQAWLLIDESQNKQQDNSLRRRITPKSVFIAPTFSPENFPECSEGYQSDSMGRCIKIIMLNKELHLDFLLQQLNDKFGGTDDYEDEEGTTAGPLNINIPLSGDVHEEADVAIVVAPTNGILQSESGMNKPFNGEKVNVGDIAGILGLRQAAEVETTTITGTSTLNTDSTTQESTTKNIEFTTLNTGGSTSEFNALFFLDPKRQVEIKTENYDDAISLLSTSSDSQPTETDIMKNTKKIKGTTNGAFDSLTDLPFLQMDQALPYSDTSISFSDTKREAIKSNTHENKIQQTESTSNTFATLSTTIIPATNFSNIYHQILPTGSLPKPLSEVKEPHSTVSSMIQTPIDNSLSNHDVIETTQPTTKSTESIFSVGFQKPNYETIFNNNKKILSNLGGTLTQKQEDQVHNSTESLTTTTEIITTTDVEETSTKMNFVSESETITYSTNIPQITMVTENVLSVSEANKVKFGTQPSHFIRFPTDKMSQTVKQSPVNVDHMLDASKQFEAIFKKYVNTRAADVSENQSHTFRNNQGISPSHDDLSQTLFQRYKAHRDNHRNRDKHSEWYHLPPKWTDTSQKPVVLRFSRKHGYIDTQQLGSNNFYREINPRLFGFPAKSRVHR